MLGDKAKGLRRFAAAGSVLAALLGMAAEAEARIEYVGEMGYLLTRYEDTLPQIAVDYSIGYTELRAANPGVDAFLPGEGTFLILPTMHLLPDAPQTGIVVNITEMRLYYFAEPNQPPLTFPIGIGREGRTTPLGQTRIVRTKEHPTWTPPPSIRAEKPWLPAVVPPGPENPLGDYALYLGWDRYLIHGTNEPFGLGRRVSSGCIRLNPEAIDLIFHSVGVGTQVTVVDQPVKFGWIDGELYMEVAPTVEQADQIEFGEPVTPVLIDGIEGMATEAAGDEAGRLDMEAVLRAAAERRGYPVRITRDQAPASST